MSLVYRTQVMCDLGARLGDDIPGCWGWAEPAPTVDSARANARRAGFVRERVEGRQTDLCPSCKKHLDRVTGKA